MFFDPKLLHEQYKGTLGLAWKAATLGIKKLNSEEVRACKITKLCNYIMQFLVSNSISPQKRMSLRLTIMLVNGTVLIWRQKVILLQEEIYALHARESDTARLRKERDEHHNSTPKPKEKKTKAKKTKASDTPEFLADTKKKKAVEVERAEEDPLIIVPVTMPEVLEQGTVQAREDEITLREDMPVQRQIISQDDFGDEGMLQPDLERMARPSQHQIVVEAEIHAPPQDRTSHAELVVPEIQIDIPSEVAQPVQPTEDIVVDIQPLLPTDQPPDVPAAAVPMEIEEEPPRAKETVDVIQEIPPTAKEADAVVREIAPEEPLEAAMAPEFREVAPRAARLMSDILRFKVTRKKYVLINKPTEIGAEEDFSDIIAEFTQRLPAFRPMDKFWQEEAIPPAREPDEEMPIPRRTGTKGSSSLGSFRKDSTGTTSLLTERSSIQKDTISPFKRPLERDETQVVELPPAANHHVVESLLKKKVTSTAEAKKRPEKQPEPVEIPMEQEIIMPVMEPVPVIPEVVPMIPEIEQPLQQPEEVLEQVRLETEPIMRRGSPEDVQFGVEWSNEVLNIVKQHHKIRPVNICLSLSKRVTKRNMAVLFATLLVLTKEGQLSLLPAPNSIELEFVQAQPGI